ncbi:MAG: type IV pilin-like G/H family protein [Microcoleaceae cyanobacterium]
MLFTKKQSRVFSQMKSLKTQKYTILETVSDTSNQGFTLIELLVAIIIIGILSAIALPTFLRQVNKAKEVEAFTRIRSILDRQLEHYVTHNQFANSLEDLQFSLSSETENYQYSVLSAEPYLSGKISLGLSKKSDLKYYAGVVFVKDGQTNTCPQIPLDLNTENFEQVILPLIGDMIANPKEYCLRFFEKLA